MTVRIELLRPDDLLNLLIEGENLRLDTDASDGPALVLDDASKPGYLIVTFPPQTVVEEAVYESSPTPPPPLPPPPTKETGKLHEHPPEAQPTLPMRSRIGGSSRLVFRIPAGSQHSIPYDIESLLDWETLQLNVSALADVPAEPTAEQRRNAPAISKPGPRDTAIELPYRLILSPNHAVAWVHAHGLKTRQGVTELWHTRLALKSREGDAIELSRTNPAPLRAIWSPDFSSKKFFGTDPPVFGEPDRDWGDTVPPYTVPPGVLTPMTPSDRHEIVVLTSAFSGYVKDMDDFRSYEPQPVKAEQLMLSPLGGWLRSRGEWDPPATYKPPRFSVVAQLEPWARHVADLAALRIQRAPQRDAVPTAALTPEDESPEPAAERDAGPRSSRVGLTFAASDLTVGAAQFESILWPQLLGKAESLLNVSEWSHIATLGRDHFVRIVYEGHLFPCGHRAALIKITERKIRDVPQGSTTPVAYLVQRMFIVVRQPLRNYRSPEIFSQLEHGGRGLPLRTIRLTTLVTPDIANPFGPCKVFPTDPNIFSFWVRLGTGASEADDLKFPAIGEDIAGENIDITGSMIFIPFSEGLAARNAVRAKYDKSGEARVYVVPGQKLTYAPKGGKDNTALTTQRLYFTSQPAPFNKTFGAFLPKLFKCGVKLPAFEALLGAPTDTEIAFHKKYLDNAPDNTTGLFARVVKETSPGVLTDDTLAAEFEAKKAGGFATPNISISGLTRDLGPMAGDATKIANDSFEPADFFKDMKDSAQLFGTFNLAELLETLTMTAGAPKVQIQQSELPPPPPLLRLFKLTTTLDWEPKVKGEFSPLGGFVKFLGSRELAGGVIKPAKFAVHARIEKTVSVPPVADASPPIVDMQGALTDFRIELLHVVEILFERFAFTAKPGKKVDVAVALDSKTPVRFIDDLEFVEKLRETIPPGLFGDGPSLDIDATRVKAGFSVGLPPVAVGVFALKDVAIGAFIELPFKDGKPVFDFGFSSRERPFNLTVAFLGGGGFFHLQVDTKGVKLLEAALEFGASASIDLGVASGGVYIMAGIYFSIERREIGGKDVDAATLGGYLRMGGELSVLGLISVSLEFYLIFAYVSEGQKKYAYGRATLTVKVEVLLFSASVEISVEKRFGGSGGDPHFIETFNTPAIWTEYASAFA